MRSDVCGFACWGVTHENIPHIINDDNTDTPHIINDDNTDTPHIINELMTWFQRPFVPGNY